MKNPAAGGGRWVEVPPERLVSWIATFGRRHDGISLVADNDGGGSLTFTAADGAIAECHPPFPPMRAAGGAGGEEAVTEGAAEAMVAHAVANRTVGVLLVRLGGYAAGVFSGSPPQLVSSKTGRRPVHGRSAAGGWSQHRFARRRENQATTALRAAADAAAGLRGDARLVPYLDRAVDRFLTVPDPCLAVLRDIPSDFLAIRIRLTEPESDGPDAHSPGKVSGVLPTTD